MPYAPPHIYSLHCPYFTHLTTHPPVRPACWLKPSQTGLKWPSTGPEEGERFPCHWCWNWRATRRYLQQASTKGPGERACLFSFPFPRHFHQASHVGVKYIPKYWEQHCGGREQEAVGSLEQEWVESGEEGVGERWRVDRKNRRVDSGENWMQI